MLSKKSKASKAVVAYVPALHAGYTALFEKYPKADLFILGKSLTALTPTLERDIRALTPKEAAQAVEALGFCRTVRVLEKAEVSKVLHEYKEVVLPDEDVSRNFAKVYLKKQKVSFVSVFLRWDKLISTAELAVAPDRVVSGRAADLRYLREAAKEAVKSPDWWRQVGAVLVKGKKLALRSYNRHFPNNGETAIVGDPRSNFNAGEYPEIYLSIHAEADIIAQAAREGVALKGAELYATTFPCSNCARLIARSGIKRVYYAQGYSRLDAEDIFKTAGVEIVLVKK